VTLIAFILILSLLVFVHELGHFLVAKWSGITVEEFAIGFPPRAVKLWQEEGKITLDGQEYVIGRKLNVSRAIQPDAYVYAETTTDEKGRPIVTRLEAIESEKDGQKPDHSVAGKLRESALTKLFKPKGISADTGLPITKVDEIIRPTEYSLNWVPFGGYVRMVGEEDPSAPGSFASKSKRIRFAVLVAGSLMNLVTAVVFFTLTAMSGVPETAVGTFVTDVLPNSPAKEAGLQVGDIIVGADDATFKYNGDLISYVDQAKGKEITLRIQRGDEMINTPIIPRINPPEGQGAMGIAINYVPVTEKIVAQEVTPDTPAARAGIQAGDMIIGAGDTEFKYADDLDRYVQQANNNEISLRLERDGQVINTSPLPAAAFETPEELGVQFEYNYDTKINYYPLNEALLSGARQTAEYVGLTFYLPIAIFRNIIPAEAARPTGPVGIYQQTASAVDAAVSLNWWFPVFFITAIVSTALAVTNLLPLPALDGGRIFFIIIEAIRGKRVAPEKEGAIHFIGLALLVMLMLVVSYYDVRDPIPAIDWSNFF
jgi:regulator of sigma E protease